MRLQLSATENEFLLDVLRQHQQRLLWELARTDFATLKSGLRTELRTLENILEKMLCSDGADDVPISKSA